MIADEGWLYLETSDLAAIIERHGLGPEQVEGKLDGCCAKPRQSAGGISIYPTMNQKAAALAVAITRSHALVDGNKRLGAICAIALCQVNGFDLALTRDELVRVFWGIADGSLGEDDVAAFFETRLTVLPPRVDE